LFLEKNSVAIGYKSADAVVVMLQLAAGELSENELADWFRTRIDPA